MKLEKIEEVKEKVKKGQLEHNVAKARIELELGRINRISIFDARVTGKPFVGKLASDYLANDSR